MSSRIDSRRALLLHQQTHILRNTLHAPALKGAYEPCLLDVIQKSGVLAAEQLVMAMSLDTG